MKNKNPNAVALGKLSKGIPKRFTAAEILKRKARIMEYNALKRSLQVAKP